MGWSSRSTLPRRDRRPDACGSASRSRESPVDGFCTTQTAARWRCMGHDLRTHEASNVPPVLSTDTGSRTAQGITMTPPVSLDAGGVLDLSHRSSLWHAMYQRKEAPWEDA